MNTLIAIGIILSTYSSTIIPYTQDEILLAKLLVVETNPDLKIVSDKAAISTIHAIKNRLKDKRWPNTYTDVIHQKDQFYGIKNPVFGVTTERTLAIARLSLLIPDISGGATGFDNFELSIKLAKGYENNFIKNARKNLTVKYSCISFFKN